MKRIAQLVTLFAVGLLIGAASAQQAKPAPAVSAELQAKFWKAQAAVQADKNAVQAAQDNFTRDQAQFQVAIKELQTYCGKDFEPQMDAKGDPACVAKPAPKKQ